MKRSVSLIVVSSLCAIAALSQQSSPPSPNAVVHVATALNHLTVLEFHEPVTMAAAGSSDFQIERESNKVFVKPIKSGAATDLFVWTASRRFAYELEITQEVKNMNFAIDSAQPAPAPTPKPVVDTETDQFADVVLTRALLGTENINYMKEWFADHTNPAHFQGPIHEALEGADLFLGLSGPGTIKPKDLAKMNRDPIVFAMANPVPEIMPEEAYDYVRIMATGRSDYPNQINNVLCFPGIFRGALDCYARDINEEMKLAAAEAIASVVSPSELNEDYIVPGVFNPKIAESVAEAVARAAHATGVARRVKQTEQYEL